MGCHLELVSHMLVGHSSCLLGGIEDIYLVACVIATAAT
jgi:hypothetical protein